MLSSKSRGNKSKEKLVKISLAESLSKVTNSSILENPQFRLGLVVVAMVIVINYVIGGLTLVH